MVKISSLLENTSNLIKVGLATITLIGVLSAFYVASASLLAVPTLLKQHDSVTVAGFKSIDKLLCLNVADHRKLDWRLCFIAPAEVIPTDGTH